MPRFGEKMNEMTIDSSQNSGRPAQQNRRDGLYDTNSNLRERGQPQRFTMEHSVYQESKMHPFLTGALAVGAGLGLAAWINSRKQHTDGYEKPRALTTTAFDASQITEHAEVYSADNQRIGRVDSVKGGQIKLTRIDSTDGKHHFIPTTWVASAAGDKVRLNRNAYVVRGQWGTQDEENNEGTPTGENKDVMTAGEFGKATGGA
jgi:hypothetical protein